MNSSKCSCPELEALLDAYHDGELDGRQSESVEQHLQACASCQAKVNSIQQVVLSLKNLPRLELQKDIAAEILRARPVASRALVIRPAFWGGLGIAVAAAFMLVVFRPAAPPSNTIAEMPVQNAVNSKKPGTMQAVQPAAVVVADNLVDSGAPAMRLAQPAVTKPAAARKGSPELIGKRTVGRASSIGGEPADSNSATSTGTSSGSDNIVEVAALADNEQDSSITESIGLDSDKDGVYALEM